ncbi:diacylglycerol/polyprenol kinase family protein [Halegenticoccus soli]|uniref:dolichol kinase n=1 Tax=Halegenticoccus soli TaxID=1985678 RepID=UPI000C6E2677|nr:dolichol kinase [Halegenticoccus soli]
MSELGRRLVHLSGTGIPLLYLLGLVSWTGLQYVLLGLSAVAAVLEAVRLYWGLDWWVYDRLTREYEENNPAGYALYMFSMTAVALAFEWYVAVPGMLMLSIGDPISGVLGSNRAGQIKQAGVLAAMFGVCFALAWPFVTDPSVGAPLPIAAAAAAVGAAGATVADGIKPIVAGYVIDDNLSIPIVASVGIFVVLRAAGT